MRAITTLLVLSLSVFTTDVLVVAQTAKPDAPVPPTVVDEEDTAEKERKVRELQRRVRQSISRNRLDETLREMKELVILDPYNADYQLALGLLYRNQGSLDEARRKFQDFLDLGGNAAVANLVIAECFAAKKQKDRAFQHLRLSAENGMNVMRAVQQFESMREYQSDTEFIKLALQLERYELDLRSYNDIFTGRFKRPVDNDEYDDELAEDVEKVWTRDQQEKELRRAKLYLANIEHYLSVGNEDRAMHFYQRLLGVLESQAKFTVPAFASEIRGLINRKEEIERGIEEIRLKYFYGKARGVIAKMENHFKSEEYPSVERLYSELESVSRNILDINSEFKQVSERVLLVGKRWVERAQIRREFNAKPLSVQGIILHQGPAVAIVNDKVIEEGKYFQDMRVVKIEPNQILFDYRGERVPLIFRRY